MNIILTNIYGIFVQIYMTEKNKENRNFIIGATGFITAIIFMIWLGSLAFYW